MRKTILLALAAGLLGSAAPAATLRVPSQYATINAALDAAVAGDSVLVAPGVYSQYETRLNPDGAWISSVAFVKAGVVLCSEGGPSVTTLTMTSTAPHSAPRIVYRYPLSGPEFVLVGFTFTGNTLVCLRCVELLAAQVGDGIARIEDCEVHDYGTGNDCEASMIVSVNLTMRRCRFHDMNANGGAFVHAAGSLLIEDCEFTNCRSGAARAVEGGPVTVRRTRFTDDVQTNGAGGACYTDTRTTALFEDCWFEGNQSLYGGGAGASGGALALWGSQSDETVRNCTFVENYTNVQGEGGAIIASGHLIVIEGNTFFGNAQAQAATRAGASITVESGTVTLRRNVIAASSGDTAVGLYQGTIHSSCNVFWQNVLGNADGFTLDPTDIEADPWFCDTAANDFTVNAASPCLPGNGNPSCTELIGAWGQGCGVVSVEPSTWGRIKNSFRSGSEEKKR
ncbi:MAG: right-handed parallel beta-helix repeat-containing protein [bacterium]